MTQQEYVIKRKLNIIELAETLGNVSEAARRTGVSRKHIYDIRRTLIEEGTEGLREKTKKVPRVKNRFSQEIEDAILDYTLQFPTHGQVRVANEINRKNGWNISDGGVRSVWVRHGLEVTSKRLKRLEKYSAETNNILTESQVQALEENKLKKEAHGEIETHHSGFLLAQDTYFVGTIKGVGKIYQQTGIDTYSNLGFAKVYTKKTSVEAADFLNDKVLPSFDEHKISVLRILTDRGGEYCGRKDTHMYQLFLQLQDIEHTRTKARHPQTNGSCEKLNQTIEREFYAIAFRKKLYSSLQEIQEDLDLFMKNYNHNRTNQGKRCKGRTPYETFLEGVELYKNKVYESQTEEVTAENFLH
jgi:transposase InsO family protein/transposase-like protein